LQPTQPNMPPLAHTPSRLGQRQPPPILRSWISQLLLAYSNAAHTLPHVRAALAPPQFRSCHPERSSGPFSSVRALRERPAAQSKDRGLIAPNRRSMAYRNNTTKKHLGRANLRRARQTFLPCSAPTTPPAPLSTPRHSPPTPTLQSYESSAPPPKAPALSQ